MMKVLPVFCAFALVVATSASPVPSPAQLDWQRMEMTMFCHFGMNTFTDREWGNGTENPTNFNPRLLECGQWARAAKDGGFKAIVLTVKHHDGFCLWPSAVTAHSVASSSWRGGKGDVVREFVDACRVEGLKVGLYLSPWDRHDPSYGSDAYNDFFAAQLAELMTNYGEIAEMWFDGAMRPNAEGRTTTMDWSRHFALIRKLQPKAVIAIVGPDVRWVGNESGFAKLGESSVQPARAGVHLDVAPGTPVWYPAECDVSIRPGWFYHGRQDAHVKSLASLMDIYFQSVGRNSVLLLNVPPDQRGLFADTDVERLREFGEAVRSLYTNKVAEGEGGGEIDLGAAKSFNLVSLSEDISKGERVKQYRLEARTTNGWEAVAQGTVVGQRQLHRIARTSATAVRLVAEFREPGSTASFAVYDAPTVAP